MQLKNVSHQNIKRWLVFFTLDIKTYIRYSNKTEHKFAQNKYYICLNRIGSMRGIIYFS